MPEWSSPAELIRDTAAFTNLQHGLLGLYAWEFLCTLEFDWAIVTGKTRFRWPLLLYFASRYILLFGLIGIAIALDTTKPINCHALYAYIQFSCDAAAGLASIIFSLRTIAIWSRTKWIISLFVPIIIGQWILILRSVIVLESTYIPGWACAIVSENTTMSAAIFLYSTCFNLITFLLSVYKLNSIRGDEENTAHRLSEMMCTDGLIYFVVAIAFNAVAAALTLVNWNIIMNVIFSVPAVIMPTVAASRLVRRLGDHSFTEPEVSGSEEPSRPNLVLRSTAAPARAASFAAGRNVGPTSIRVRMETVTHTDDLNGEAYTCDTRPESIPKALSMDIHEAHKRYDKEGSEDGDEDEVKVGHGL